MHLVRISIRFFFYSCCGHYSRDAIVTIQFAVKLLSRRRLLLLTLLLLSVVVNVVVRLCKLFALITDFVKARYSTVCHA